MADVANWAGLNSAPPSIRTAFRDPATGDTADGGIFMSPDQQWLLTLDPVAAGDNFIAGVAMTPEGAIRAVAADDGLPEGAVLINGIAVSATGQLCISSSAELDHYMHGWPVSVLGVVIVDDGGTPNNARVLTTGVVRALTTGETRVIT